MSMRRREILGGLTGFFSVPVLSSEANICRGDSIIRSVNEADIAKSYDPWTGDCWHIAVALSDAYNVDIRGFYHSNDIKYPVHVFVENESRYYDGLGRLRTSEFLDEWPNTIPEIVSFSREDITDIPYYEDSLRMNIYDLIVDTEGYSSWSGC